MDKRDNMKYLSDMKFYRFAIIALFVGLAAVFAGGCSDDDGIDNRDLDYGYVQFRLYKEASYDNVQKASASGTRVVTQLNYLSDACKVRVVLGYGPQTIVQTLTLMNIDPEMAEYGIRSEKLKLLTGDYEIVTFTLYDVNDDPLYNGTTENARLSVVSGGLTTQDLTVNVVPRGKVKFSLVKNPNLDVDFPDRPYKTRATTYYPLEQVDKFDVSVLNTETNELLEFEDLEGEYSVHFDDEDADTPEGYQTSSIACDSLLSIPAGTYQVVSYAVKNGTSILETNNAPQETTFRVEDNKTTEAKVLVTLHEAADYIQDYYALYKIWRALDGPNWSYRGQAYPSGCNWHFDKDPDLWGDQPGVSLHSNGRVQGIDLSDFGFRGNLPKEIGDLSELLYLYLGTHNDAITGYEDPTTDLSQSVAEHARNRMSNHKEYLRRLHPATPISAACALALRYHDIDIEGTRAYKEMSTDEIFKLGLSRNGVPEIKPMDMNHGTINNGLTSLPAEIGKLKKLERLYIANCPLTSLPEADPEDPEGAPGMAGLTGLTDLELYNCPKMTQFPDVIAQLPSLISVNIANNSQWSSEEINQGLEELAKGASQKKIQILYCGYNNLSVLPPSMKYMDQIGLIDFSYNQLSGVLPGLGLNISPVQFYLDHNKITGFGLAEDGYFCRTDDLETFSAAYNELEEFPNIFTSKTAYTMLSVDFSNNKILKFPDDFKGIKVETLTLVCNPITKYPKALAASNSLVESINLRGCQIDEIPEGSFTKGENTSATISFDLSYNKLSKFPEEFRAHNLAYLYGLDISYNQFDAFPWEPLNCSSLTVFALRGQRKNGARCLREWPTGIGEHYGLRGFFIGSNDLRVVNDDISYLIYQLDISDNPSITFDASDICAYWQAGLYTLIYDKTQNITGCDAMLEE